MEIVYSRSLHPACAGRTFRNPRHFAGPLDGACRVLLDGSFPNIEAAYKARGVAVERLDVVAAPDVAGAAVAAAQTSPLSEDERASLYIPDDWRDLPWSKGGGRDLTLRGLAAPLSSAPVLNKAQAVAAIEDELDRRKAHLGV